MQQFFELIRWLYPAAHHELDIQPSDHNPKSFVRAIRLLMSSGRDEALFLAIQCINEDRAGFALAIRKGDWHRSFPEAALKPTRLCEIALTSPGAMQMMQQPISLLREERLQLREKLKPTLDCCLPALLWTSICDLAAYTSISQLGAPQQMAKLLYCFSLTFLPDEHAPLTSSDVAGFIHHLDPRQTVSGLPEDHPLQKRYSRTLEARMQAIKKLHGSSRDHKKVARKS